MSAQPAAFIHVKVMITEAATAPSTVEVFRTRAAGLCIPAIWQREALLLLLYGYAAVMVTYPLVTF